MTDLSALAAQLPDLAAGDEQVLSLVFIDRPAGGPNPRTLAEAAAPTATFIGAMATLLGNTDPTKAGITSATANLAQVLSEPFGSATLADLDGV